jgi:translation initiation factor IF-1
MSGIIDIIRRVVRQELARSRGSQLGVVTAIFPHTAGDDQNNYEVSVRLKHEDLELRRVPMAVGHVGVAAPPRIGDLVLVQFVDGDLNQPLVTGRFYHADERPPLHHEGEVLFEQRVPDGTLNHLRFTADGTIYLQRDVTKPEDNSAATASIKIDGESGDIQVLVAERKASIAISAKRGDIAIRAGDNVAITLKHDNSIEIVADGRPIAVRCDRMMVTGNVEIRGDLTLSDGFNSVTISGNEIRGA